MGLPASSASARREQRHGVSLYKRTNRRMTERQYGFYDRLTADFPSQIVVDITEVCNLACIHCPHPTFKASDLYSAAYLDPQLNEKMVEEVRTFGANRTQYIRYTSNGEPLVHPKGFEMVAFAARHAGTFVTLTTNGTIMNEKRARRLLESGIHMIDVSIDAHTPETYARVRVNGDLEVTRKNVLNLIRWAREAGQRTKVVVSFVEQAENSREVHAFERYWRDQGADEVVVRRLHSAAGAVIRLADVMRKKNAPIPRRPCVYPWERILLDPKGWLAFCPTDWKYGSTVGDYRKTTIRDVWQGDFYRRLREAHLTNRFDEHGFCGQCPDWSVTAWPGEGLSYANLVERLKTS